MSQLVKKKVAIAHPHLGCGNGGSESKAIWAVEALKPDFAISLVTAGPVDLAQLNLFYGTAIRPEDVSICRLPMPRVLAGARAPSALRGAFNGRALKSIAREHDILISTYNPSDFGVPAIQCVADFSWDEDLRRRSDPRPGGVHGWFHRSRWLRHYYLQLCRTISPPSGRDLFSGEDLIIANSQWTATKLRERYGAIALVVYPPVVGSFPHVSDQHRTNDFVCIGRISPEKRIERMIRIIGAVRNRGHDVRIRIVGPIDDSPYSKKITALAGLHREWVVLEGRKLGAEKACLLTDCRYGLHGREGEAFGIGVAEMVKAGCITFAPAEGGPAEILNHASLLYHDDEEAVEKIVAVLDSEALRHELGCHLRRQADRFSAERFMANIRQTVLNFADSASRENSCQMLGTTL
jgi:glycosyltransferase involved in cell wall biosynthesis